MRRLLQLRALRPRAGSGLVAGPVTDREERVLGIIETARAKRPRFKDAHVTMAHGAGGKATQTLIEGLFVPAFGSPALAALADAGTVSIGGVQVALTTDSFVVKPIRFPGGSIGELAVNGTVNDLAVAGARPQAISLSMVLEEGLAADVLRAEVEAIAAAAAAAGVEIVAGDTKVVERGHADQMYLCTTGVGAVDPRAQLSPSSLRPGDRILVSGTIGDHGTAIMLARGEFELDAPVESDTCSLWPAVDALLDAAGRAAALHARRDPRRRGLGAQRAGAGLRRGDDRARGRRARRAGGGGRRGDPRHRPDVRGQRGQARRLRRSRGGGGGAGGAARGAGLRARGGDRRGEDGATGDGAGGDGVRRQAGHGPAGGRPAAPDLLNRKQGGPMSGTVEFVPGQQKTEAVTAHVLWVTTGLSCEGDSVAMTSATNPSLEDIIQGVIPGMPRVVIHNQVIAYEVGQEYIQAWYDAEQGKLDPFVLIIEGSIPNEEINGEGHWTGFGVNPENGQPITTNEWVDRLANKAAAVVAIGTCATYGGIPAMKNNPTGAMGLPDYLGWKWKSKAGLPVVCIPGCPAQPDNMTETLLYLVLHLGGLAPAPELDDQLRPEVAVRAHRARELQPRRLHRAGPVRHRVRRRPALPGQARLQGAGGALQRAGPRVGQRHRRLPERRRHLHGLHDARLPRQVHALHGPRPVGQRRGQHRALHLRPAPEVLPQSQHQDEVRQGARVAQARAPADHRLPEALVRRIDHGR